MTIVYVLLPISLLLALGAGLAFRWAVNNQQFDDFDSPPIRMLADENTVEGIEEAQV